MSFWDDDLEGSEEASQKVVNAVYDVAGTNPSRRTFDVLSAMVVGVDGNRTIANR